MSILAKEFPLAISSDSDGGPLFDTRVTKLRSGFERRNKNWSQYQYQANIYRAIRTQEDYETLYSFFLEMGGMAYGFLFTNPGDYKSCPVNDTVAFDDTDLGNGDGATAAFQLEKSYGTARTEVKTIKRPKSGTVKVGIDGIEDVGSWSVSTVNGLVTFTSQSGIITNAEDIGGGVTRITDNGHGLSTGQTAYVDNLTGDWAGMNGQRYKVTVLGAAQFTVAHDSSGYTTYSSNAGDWKTLPQTGEALTAGFEYYFPVRFSTDFMRSTYAQFESFDTELSVIEVKE